MIEQLFNIDLNKTPLSSKKDKTNREKILNYSLTPVFQIKKTKTGNLLI